ncbi:flavin-containing monooxygenase [Rhodococcus sp. NPDC019627]|uniref:flavin-containing monooxygenase n=1 Tax=unclassified Rhodococcus (in: high G+C Gram-positive bacteria) TaxID=192944 RepID=UPI0033CE2FD3
MNHLTGDTWSPIASDDELTAAVEAGNIPTLQLVLTQLTGDASWLTGRYAPSRTIALDDNDTGGLSDEDQSTIRKAVIDAVRAIRDGEATVPPPPSDDRLVEMLSASLGEEVPTEYGKLMSEEGNFRPREALAWSASRPAAADDMRILVVGAGASGIAAGVQLLRLGIPFTIVERESDLGGVWRDNVYPGAGVDTPAHLYSFSFAPHNWSRYYAKQPEVHSYLSEIADEYGVRDHVRFNTTVKELRWNSDLDVWDVEVDHPSEGTSTFSARAVLTCVGTLTEPSVPDLPGSDIFAGKQFHSARWDLSAELDGRKVAIIGTGATAMQIVPAIADRSEHTTIFQRTPQWLVPNANYLRAVSEGVNLLMTQVPFYAAFYRLRLIWQFQDKLLATLKRDPLWEHPERSVNAQNDKHRRFLTKAMLDQLGQDAETMAHDVIPAYPPYSKRILMDNEWIDTIRRDDVSLVAKAITRLDTHHVIDSDGMAHEADIVVYATGFQVRKMLASLNVIGRDGSTIRDAWGEDDASAYVGVTVPNFPNFFVIGGPQTTPAHGGSAIYISECAIAYALGALIKMIENDIAAIEVKRDVFEDYNNRVDAEHETLVWTHPGTTNWYRNARGRVISALPWRGVDYRALTEAPNLDDYIITPARAESRQLV